MRYEPVYDFLMYFGGPSASSHSHAPPTGASTAKAVDVFFKSASLARRWEVYFFI
jgi:hypothetical protein